MISIAIFSAIFWSFVGNNQTIDCRGSALCYRGVVTQIIDGDTIQVDDYWIRLALVNTPEIGEVGYLEAKEFTGTLCPVGSNVLVDEDDGQTERSFGRIVAVVFCGGTNLNAELVKSGHAGILINFCSISEFKDDSWAKSAGC
ncbi:MAG: thermonuclease family protein [Nitrososphaerales archaeon]